MIDKTLPTWTWRGWEVELKTGEIIMEGEQEWNNVPRKDIVRLSLLFDGRKWDLVGDKNYFQKKRASVGFGQSIVTDAVIESRTIGYYDKDGKKVCYTVNEHTGDPVKL